MGLQIIDFFKLSRPTMFVGDPQNGPQALSPSFSNQIFTDDDPSSYFADSKYFANAACATQKRDVTLRKDIFADFCCIWTLFWINAPVEPHTITR